jgi:hypothetical protein
MLSVIKDRIDNADRYEREYFSKYPQFGYSRRKIGFSIDDLWEPKKKKYFPGRRRIMSQSTICKQKPTTKLKVNYILIMMMVCTRECILN